MAAALLLETLQLKNILTRFLERRFIYIYTHVNIYVYAQHIVPFPSSYSFIHYLHFFNFYRAENRQQFAFQQELLIRFLGAAISVTKGDDNESEFIFKYKIEDNENIN